MPEVRKLVTQGLFNFLADPGPNGFNAQYRSALATGNYPSAEPVLIEDWSHGLSGVELPDPKQFFLGQIDEGELDASQMLKYPAVNLYTVEIDGSPSDFREKSRKFSGLVTVGLKWILKHRGGIESDNVEDTVAAIDDAVLEVLNLISGGSLPGVSYNGDYKSGTARTELLGNGWKTIFPSTITFFVSV